MNMLNFLKKYIIKIFKMTLAIITGTALMFVTVVFLLKDNQKNNIFFTIGWIVVFFAMEFLVSTVSKFKKEFDITMKDINQAEVFSNKTEALKNPMEDILKIGPFPCQISREVKVDSEKILTQAAGDRIFTLMSFKIDVPPVHTFCFKISNVNSSENEKYNSIKEKKISDEEFISSLHWEISEQELLQAFQAPDAIHHIRSLFILGIGTIACGDGVFSIQLRRGAYEDEQWEFFQSTSKALFWIYAKVAQMNVREWRFPQNNYDWWNS